MGTDSSPVYGTDTPENREEIAQLGEDEKQEIIDASARAVSESRGAYESKSVKNILLIGVDTRNESYEGASSDSIILLSIDDAGKRLILTSVMRDTYLVLPGENEPSKLQSAIIKGGPEHLEETIEAYFGAKTDNYALVNFTGFEELIDAAGGLDLKLSDSECYRAEVTDESLVDAEKGIYHVNGRQALLYCRNRTSTLGSDYDRTQRQRTVLKTLWDKVKEMPVTKQAALASDALQYVTTDLSRGECLSLVGKLPGIRDYEFVSQRIPIDGTSIAYYPYPELSIVSMDFAPNREFLLESLYGIREEEK